MVLIERLFLICVLTSVVHSVPECTFPAVFQSSTWTDSDHGELQFSTDTMAGWTAEYTSNKNSFVVTIDQWECFYVLSNATSTTLIVKATGTFVYDGSGTLKFRPYLCMEMTSISNVSYYYYLQWGEQTNLNNHPRVTVMPDTTVITDPYGQLCDSVATTNEYHVIVKQGFAASAVQMCSSDYYGIYSYAISSGVDSDTNVMCNDGTERWNVCEDKYIMGITYSTCSTPIGSSASGSLSCLATLQSGSYTLQTVYDNDADVTSPQDRFTCFMSSLSNDGSLTVSQSPHSCTKTQTPFAQPVLNNGTTVGLTLALTPIPNGLCPITTTTTTTTTTTVTSGNSPASSASSSSGSTSTGVIVGATIGSLAALAAIAALLICCLYGKFRSRRRDNQIASTPVHSDKNALHIEADDDNERGRHTDDKTKANPKPHSDKWDERIEPIAGHLFHDGFLKSSIPDVIPTGVPPSGTRLDLNIRTPRTLTPLLSPLPPIALNEFKQNGKRISRNRAGSPSPSEKYDEQVQTNKVSEQIIAGDMHKNSKAGTNHLMSHSETSRKGGNNVTTVGIRNPSTSVTGRTSVTPQPRGEHLLKSGITDESENLVKHDNVRKRSTIINGETPITSLSTENQLLNVEQMKIANVPVEYSSSSNLTNFKGTTSITSLPNNPMIVKTYFEMEDLKYKGRFIDVKNSPLQNSNKEINIQNAETVGSLKIPLPIRRASPKPRNMETNSEVPKAQKDAIQQLSRSRSNVTFINTTGTFYNDQNIPLLNSTARSKEDVNTSEVLAVSKRWKETAYDEDNVKAWAMRATPELPSYSLSPEIPANSLLGTNMYTTEDNYLKSSFESATPVSHRSVLSQSKVSYELSTSPVAMPDKQQDSKQVKVSEKDMCATSQIPLDRSFHFFLENEHINVRGVPDVAPEDGDVDEDSANDNDEEEDTYEDEENEEQSEGEMDTSDKDELADHLDGRKVETAMTVYYGDREDPDKMNIGDYI